MMWMTWILAVLPEEEEGPVYNTKDEINFKLVVEGSLQKVAMINKVYYRFSEKEYNREDEYQIVHTSEFRIIEFWLRVSLVKIGWYGLEGKWFGW